MPTSGKTRTLEDLDTMAADYVRARSEATAARAARLREDFVRGALPFAGRLARRYRGRGEQLDDLEQVARLGLMKAVDRYDVERGSFTAYAVITITGEIKRHFRDHTWGVHVPRRLQDLVLELNHANSVLTAKHARTPTNTELAAFLEVSEAEVTEARTSLAGYSPASLNSPAGDDDRAEFGDLVGSADPELGLVDDRTTVERLLYRLPYRERRMLALRFWGNLSQAEIADQLGISQMHVSRLLSRALTWLRAAMLSDTPPAWTGTERDDHHVRILVRRESEGVLRVAVSGEVDRDNAEHLREELLAVVRAARADRLLLDLADVPFLDVAGIAVLLAVHEAARVRDVRVKAVGLRSYVAKVAAATGLNALLDD
jgi:RNA polymerase sigma-B factor